MKKVRQERDKGMVKTLGAIKRRVGGDFHGSGGSVFLLLVPALGHGRDLAAVGNTNTAYVYFPSISTNPMHTQLSPHNHKSTTSEGGPRTNGSVLPEPRLQLSLVQRYDNLQN